VKHVVDCVFCDLLASGDALWVARGRDAVAFLPLPASALAPGHTLVVPRKHCRGFFDAGADVLSATSLMTQRVARAMRRALGATGVVVLNASGPHSGQSVDHLHFHVVPCWPDDDATFWPRDRSAHPPIENVHEVLARDFE
jgi:histidine triad (HIT) family protein